MQSEFSKVRCHLVLISFECLRLEHERRMHLSGCNESTLSLALMMPTLIDEVFNNDYDEDKHPTNNLFDEYIELETIQNHIGKSSKSIEKRIIFLSLFFS